MKHPILLHSMVLAGIVAQLLRLNSQLAGREGQSAKYVDENPKLLDMLEREGHPPLPSKYRELYRKATDYHTHRNYLGAICIYNNLKQIQLDDNTIYDLWGKSSCLRHNANLLRPRQFYYLRKEINAFSLAMQSVTPEWQAKFDSAVECQVEGRDREALKIYDTLHLYHQSQTQVLDLYVHSKVMKHNLMLLCPCKLRDLLIEFEGYDLPSAWQQQFAKAAESHCCGDFLTAKQLYGGLHVLNDGRGGVYDLAKVSAVLSFNERILKFYDFLPGAARVTSQNL